MTSRVLRLTLRCGECTQASLLPSINVLMLPSSPPIHNMVMQCYLQNLRILFWPKVFLLKHSKPLFLSIIFLTNFQFLLLRNFEFKAEWKIKKTTNSFSLLSVVHRVTEWLRLGWTSGDHLVERPSQAEPPIGNCPDGLWTCPRMMTP